MLTTAGLLFYYDSKLHRVDALANYPGRPAAAPGTTWLLVGTDSRDDLSEAERDRLGTGYAEGARTDTIMLAHVTGDGTPMLISIPRDLYVDIPGLGKDRVNAAFNDGGARLLVQAVEGLLGFRVDHYAEISFGGFDRLVDGIGGVEVCLDAPMSNPEANIELPAGCQRLDGAQSLGLVRNRYGLPGGSDLERIANQRMFMSALVSQAMSPGVLLNPFRLFPFLNGATASLTVDSGAHIWDLAWLGDKLRGDVVTTSLPTDDAGDGGGVNSSDATEAFLGYLRKGELPPEELRTQDSPQVG